ncbi:hypothetical protein HPB49_012728 [Dermacentor silvarum]|uniref:Uncharacterized protein n=1 Tax=Dermacentor silvarum TaxID=543639 RepID=A0ACB8CRG0_DERSI|nr:hypothetical protein HPB49_012728 [Dermacentor silvarum]
MGGPRLRVPRGPADRLPAPKTSSPPWRTPGPAETLAMLLLIDVKGAFDGLPHAVVQQALDLLGIGGNLRRFLSSFLNDRTLRVRVGHARSTPPRFLFNLALARLPAALPTDPHYKVECSIYADDIALWVRGPPQSSRHVCLALQRALDTTAAYLGSIGLSHLLDGCLSVWINSRLLVALIVYQRGENLVQMRYHLSDLVEALLHSHM